MKTDQMDRMEKFERNKMAFFSSWFVLGLIRYENRPSGVLNRYGRADKESKMFLKKVNFDR